MLDHAAALTIGAILVGGVVWLANYSYRLDRNGEWHDDKGLSQLLHGGWNKQPRQRRLTAEGWAYRTKTPEEAERDSLEQQW